MAEGRKRFLDVFAAIEEGRRCEQFSIALSALADGERDVVGAEDVDIHLRTCGSCRAKLRAFRAIPDRVLELMPAGPALEQSTGGRAHEWLADRVGGAIERVREGAYSLANRGTGSEGEAAAGMASGLQASAAKALAVCGVAVAGTGGAYCVVKGVAPADLIGDRGEQQQQQMIDMEPGATPRPPELSELPAPPPTAAPAQDQDQTVAAPDQPLTPAQQTTKELGIEQVAPSSSAPSGGEFSAPTGGGSGGGGSGGGEGGFGFE